MNGLLNFLRTPEGVGLLGAVGGYASSAQRGAPINSIGRGLLAGTLAYGQGLDRQERISENAQQKQVRDIQMQAGLLGLDKTRRDMAQEQAIRDAAKQSMVSPEQANAMSMGPMPDGSFLPQVQPGFNQASFLQSLKGIAPLKAMEFEQTMRKANAPVSVAAGASLVDPTTNRPVYTAPAAPKEQPSAVREYEFARGQGFQGSFEQWQTQQKKAGATSVNVTTGQKGLDNELKIRSDFRSEPIYKAHNEVDSAYRQITQSLKMGSPAGDLAGATKIMKILDPGSVVRESELGMAMAATGAIDRMTNYADMVIKGTKLTPDQRKDFQSLADKLYAESSKSYNAKRGEYAGFATDYQLNADRILGPAITSPKLPKPAAGGQAFATMPPANPGNKGRFLTDQQTGQRFQSDGFRWVPAQ